MTEHQTSGERPPSATLAEWIARCNESEFGVVGFLDYCEATIDEETDMGTRVGMRVQLDDLRHVVEASS